MQINQNFSADAFIAYINDRCHKQKHREILKDRYCEELTFSELADKYHYSERHVKTIVYRYDDLILKFLKNEARE